MGDCLGGFTGVYHCGLRIEDRPGADHFAIRNHSTINFDGVKIKTAAVKSFYLIVSSPKEVWYNHH
jgi:hypothetical protein